VLAKGVGNNVVQRAKACNGLFRALAALFSRATGLVVIDVKDNRLPACYGGLISLPYR
jgi:hypothetical protein